MIRALIFDLDNTIYPVSAIAGGLFRDLFALVDHLAVDYPPEVVEQIKDAFTRRPYQLVADKYNFKPELRQAGLDLLRNLHYELPMQPFADYHLLREIPLPKFLVTTGFINLQTSKIRMLGIEHDFKEIHIVDPEAGIKTKEHVFAEIMETQRFAPDELLVIGDDPESEIRAAIALGIPTFLFDPDGRHVHAASTWRSERLRDVVGLI